MTDALRELLFEIRQHAAFKELLGSIEAPQIKAFRQGEDAGQQHADHVFRSGRRLQDQLWRQFLIGEPPSQQEKS